MIAVTDDIQAGTDRSDPAEGNERPPLEGDVTNLRLVIIWLKEADARWRVAREMEAYVNPI